MEITQAIRKLLFLEDCVIIPGFGGFVSQYRPAVIDKATGTFIPPAKEIVFNSGLVQNDGTLVNYIAVKLAVSQDEARRQIDRFVEDSMVKLARNEKVFIDGVGQFTQDKNREIHFRADAGTNLFLDSFGLASFHLGEVSRETNTRQDSALRIQKDEISRTVEFSSENNSKSRFGRNLRRIAIAVPLLIAFSLLPFNSRIGDTLISSPASMVPEPSFLRLNYPEIPIRDTSRVIEFPIKEDLTGDQVTNEISTGDKAGSEAAEVGEVKKEEVKKEEVKPVEIKVSTGKYPVIAGCFKVKENADRLHKLLVDKGYPASITVSRTGLYKVSVQSFATREEAVNGLARIKKAEPKLQLWASI